jgi:hypothetical protein
MVHDGKAPAGVGGVDFPMHAKCSEDVTRTGVRIESDRPTRESWSGGERLAGGQNDIVGGVDGRISGEELSCHLSER